MCSLGLTEVDIIRKKKDMCALFKSNYSVFSIDWLKSKRFRTCFAISDVSKTYSKVQIPSESI